MYLKIYLTESQIIEDINKKYNGFNSNYTNIKDLKEIEPPDKLIKFNDTFTINSNFTKKKIDNTIKVNNSNNGRIGVGFVYKSLYGNGIARVLSLLCSELAKLEKYDIYVFSGPPIPSIEFPMDKRVIRVPICCNKTLMQKYDENTNIKIYVLQNDLTPSSIKWYQNLNGGKKIIGIVHGVYMSSIFANLTGVYSIWKYNQLYDAYVSVIADDYYFNKRLGINNSFFLHNLYTYEPDETPNSNLTY